MAANVTRFRPNRTSLTQTVQAAVNAAQTTPTDAGAVQLALDYAKAIDEAQDRAEALEKLGPKLLAALAELGLTPKARSALLKGAPDGSRKPSALDGLRNRSAARADRAQAVDTPAP